MKQLERYLLYFLLLAVIGLYIFQFSGQSNEEIDETTTDSLITGKSSPKEGLIYYVNTDTLWDNFLLVQDIFKELETKKNQYESQMESRVRAFQTEVNDFQQQGRSMSEVELQIKQRELMRKESEIAELKENLETKFMTEEKEWNDKLRARILGYIEQKTKDRKYDYILGYSLTSNIILANDSLNITDEILDGLNEQYKLEKEKKK